MNSWFSFPWKWQPQFGLSLKSLLWHTANLRCSVSKSPYALILWAFLKALIYLRIFWGNMHDSKSPLTTPFWKKKPWFSCTRWRAQLSWCLLVPAPMFTCQNCKKNWMVVYHTICSLYPFIHNNGILQFLLKVIFFAVFSNCAWRCSSTHTTHSRIVKE